MRTASFAGFAIEIFEEVDGVVHEEVQVVLGEGGDGGDQGEHHGPGRIDHIAHRQAETAGAGPHK